MKPLLLILLTALVAACVPKNQYDAVVTERNYYRNQTSEADSLAELASLNTYDRIDAGNTAQIDQIRQIESLTATNRALNESYQTLQRRYDELLTTNQSLLDESGTTASELQQNLADRLALVSQREAELRQAELDLRARTANAPAQQARGVQPAPSAYGTVSATTPLGVTQNAALTLNGIQNELSQILAAAPRQSYTMAPAGPNRVQVTLAEPLLYADGFTVSAQGQQLLRRMATTLRDYPQAEITVVGHTDASDNNPLRAFENSTDKAINVAQQLLNFGLIPSKVTAAGKGFNDPVADNGTPTGQAANRRTDLFISIR